jgi:glycosyltransferase involved in cell wall biosynthesis
MPIFKNKKRRILCVVPSASINGAIVVLMNFLSWLKQNHPDNDIETLVQWGKDNNPDTFYRNKLLEFGKVTFLQDLTDQAKEDLKKQLRRKRIDCILFNSIISVETQIFLEPVNAPRVFFVHEMERLMHMFRLPDHMHLYNKQKTHFVACSTSVKDDLRRVMNIPEQQITVIHEFIDVNHIYDQLKNIESSSQNPDFYNKLLQNEKSGLTIGFSGTFELRKSADLLPPLVLEIRKRVAKPTIIWVGASTFNGEPATFDMVMNDVKTAGLTNDIVFIPKGLGHYKYYNRFDVFVMLSREDPFPLVNLEMGALGVPMICFERSGGSQEYAEMGGGVTVPFMDLGAIADQVKYFNDNPDRLNHYKNITPGIIKNNFTPEIQAPKLFKIISELSS